MNKVLKDDQPCPKCPSTDAYHLYEDGSGWCFSCNRGTFPKDYHPKLFTEAPLSDRGIPSKIGEKFAFSQFADKEGNVIFHAYHYPGGKTKYRRCKDKHFWMEGEGKMPGLGGIGLYDPGTHRAAVVVEGEVDGASAYHILNKGQANERPVYWLTSASIPQRAEVRKEIYDELSKYEEVILAFENDEAGKKAKETLASLLPNKVYVAPLTIHKDANEYLTNGKADEFKRAVTNRSRYVAEFVYTGEARFREILDDPETEFYIPTPFSKLNERIRGLPLGHVVLVAGPEGLGKTELLRSFEYEVLTKAKDYPIAVVHFEEPKKTVLKGLACYQAMENFRDPDNPRDTDSTLRALDGFLDNLYLVDFYKIKEEMNVAAFLSKLDYLHNVCGVRYFFFDPINQLRPENQDETLVKFLDGIAMGAAKFAVENNCCIVWSAHVNDEGETRDSRMIGKACSIRIDIDRDKMAVDETAKNTTAFYVSKNRPYSNTGHGGFAYFDPSTFTLSDQTFEANEGKGYAF